MAFKVIRNINHSRVTGEKDGKKTYFTTKIGVVLRDEKGVEILKYDYTPNCEGQIFLNEPKQKEEKPF